VDNYTGVIPPTAERRRAQHGTGRNVKGSFRRANGTLHDDACASELRAPAQRQRIVMVKPASMIAKPMARFQLPMPGTGYLALRM